MRLATILTGMVVLCVSFGTAQSTTGVILGWVSDTSNLAAPGARVTLTNTETNFKQQRATDEGGNYIFLSVDPGHYEIAVELEGFKRFVKPSVVLQVAQTARVDVVLELGTLTETVTVESTLPLLATDTSSLDQVINNKQIVELPLRTRNVMELVNLTSGVTLQSTGNNAYSFSINGGRSGTNDVLLDGIVQSQAASINQPAYVPSVDAVEEFRVHSSSYSAEFGHSGGGVVNMVLKSGTNDFHGTIFHFLRNDKIEANNFFANRAGRAKAPFRYNQFGWSIGGPILRNKTFFFHDLQATRIVQSPTAIRTLPLPGEHGGDFSRRAPIFDPFSVRLNPNGSGFVRDSFPGNQIPESQLDPAAINAMTYIPFPNLPGTSNNFVSQDPRRTRDHQWDVKVDHYASEGHRLTGSFSFYRQDGSGGLDYGTPASTGGFNTFLDSRSAAVTHVWTLSPVRQNNLRFGFSRWFSKRRDAFDFQVGPSQLGIPIPVTKNHFPTFRVAGMSQYGGPGTNFIDLAATTYHLSDGLTLIHAGHSIKIGGEFRQGFTNTLQPLPINADWTFAAAMTNNPQNTRGTGFGQATFMLGMPTSGLSAVTSDLALGIKYFSLYVQDDYKLGTRLTLNYGLRWETETPKTDRYNRLTNFDPNLTNPIAGVPGGLTFVGVPPNSRGQWEIDSNNFGPRFGLAYRPTEKMVVRLGGGVFFAPAGGRDARTENQGISGFQAITGVAFDGVNPTFRMSDGPPVIFLPTGSSLGASTGVGGNISFLDRGNTTPYSMQWMFGLQRELRGSFLLEAAYTGNRGVHLITNVTNRNQLRPEMLALGTSLQQLVPNPYYEQGVFGPTVARAQLLRPYPQFLSVNDGGATIANSIYHALQVRAERRVAKGLFFLVSYTFSKLIDDSANFLIFQSGQGRPGFQDFYNRRADRSLSENDIPQLLVVSYVYDLPIGRGSKLLGNAHGFANKLISGWQLNGIVRMASGFPLGISESSDLSNSLGDGWNTIRPNVVGPVRKIGRVEQWFDTSAFSSPGPFRFGNAPRLMPDLRGPGVKRFDLSLFKKTSITERVTLQFRSEWFNAFNTPIFGLPNLQRGSAAFGSITSLHRTEQGSRVIQFGLKLLF